MIMKKYISPRIEEIKMKADVIATSMDSTHDQEGWTPGGGFAPDRYGRGRYDAEYDLY